MLEYWLTLLRLLEPSQCLCVPLLFLSVHLRISYPSMVDLRWPRLQEHYLVAFWKLCVQFLCMFLYAVVVPCCYNAKIGKW